MNKNPTLLCALALVAVEKSGVEIKPVEREKVALRVYPNNGAGWFFVRACAPGRWYWKDASGSDHFNRAEQEEVDAAIADGSRVQLTGYRDRSLGLWPTWEEFERAVEK